MSLDIIKNKPNVPDIDHNTAKHTKEIVDIEKYLNHISETVQVIFTNSAIKFCTFT